MVGIELRVLLATACLLLAACVDEVDDADEGDGSIAESESAESESDAAESDASGETGESLDQALAEAWQLERFIAEVQPIFDAHCAGCHSAVAGQLGLALGPSSELAADVLLPGIVDRQAVIAPLALIEPGDPSQSWLVRKITGDFEGVACDGGCGGPMPPAGEPLDDAELAALTDWISAMEPTP